MTRPRRRFRYPTAGMLLATALAGAGVWAGGKAALALIALAGRAIGVRP